MLRTIHEVTLKVGSKVEVIKISSPGKIINRKELEDSLQIYFARKVFLLNWRELRVVDDYGFDS